jgi:predicted nucleotidyltransferase
VFPCALIRAWEQTVRAEIPKAGFSSTRAVANNIIAVYLFGYYAKGTYKENSDIDLAFVFNEDFYKKDPFRALQEAELIGVEISKKILRPMDVVILNWHLFDSLFLS